MEEKTLEEETEEKFKDLSNMVEDLIKSCQENIINIKKINK